MPATSEDDLRTWRMAVRAAMEKASPLGSIREALEGAPPQLNTWREMERDIGLTGLHLRDEDGGLGGTVRDLAVAFEELGRALYPGPALETAVALDVLARAGQRMPLGQVLAGAGVAIALEPQDIPEATARGEAYRLTGDVTAVLGATDAEIALVRARLHGHEAILMLRPDGNIPRTWHGARLDPSRQLWSMHLHDFPAGLVAEGEQAEAVLDAAVALAAVLVAAEAAGGTLSCLDRAVAYAKERVQFGYPIGQNQAIKHQCADMLLLAESARLSVQAAAEELDSASVSANARVAVHVAKVCATDAFLRSAVMSMHVFGGRGYLWEDDAHLYLRRSVVDSTLFGGTAAHRDAVADHLARLCGGTAPPARSTRLEAVMTV